MATTKLKLHLSAFAGKHRIGHGDDLPPIRRQHKIQKPFGLHVFQSFNFQRFKAGTVDLRHAAIGGQYHHTFGLTIQNGVEKVFLCVEHVLTMHSQRDIENFDHATRYLARLLERQNMNFLLDALHFAHQRFFSKQRKRCLVERLRKRGRKTLLQSAVNRAHHPTADQFREQRRQRLPAGIRRINAGNTLQPTAPAHHGFCRVEHDNAIAEHIEHLIQYGSGCLHRSLVRHRWSESDRRFRSGH